MELVEVWVGDTKPRSNFLVNQGQPLLHNVTSNALTVTQLLLFMEW